VISAAAIAIGSNLGDRLAHVQGAVRAIGELATTRVVALSSIIETEAMVSPGQPPGPAFLNAAVCIETGLQPLALLGALLEIERTHGRDRRSPNSGHVVRWGARTLDLDLLWHGETVLATPELTLPHPSLHLRRFVLEPLVQIAPGWVHPLLMRTPVEMLAR